MSTSPETVDILPNAADVSALRWALHAQAETVRARAIESSGIDAVWLTLVSDRMALASEALFQVLNHANVYGESAAASAALRDRPAGV